MRRNWKKGISLLLAASMAFSLNVVSFAGEIIPDEDVAAKEIVAEEAAGAEIAEAPEEAVGAEILEAAEEGAAVEVAGAAEEVAGSEVTEVTEETGYSVQAEDGQKKEEEKKTVSDPSAEPTTWTTDPVCAEKTFMLYLKKLLKDDTLAVSLNKIVNGKVVMRDAVPASQNMAISLNNLVFEAEHMKDDYYLLVGYGINEGEGVDTLDDEGMPAGIYDSQSFTWHDKNVNSKSNGKVYFDAAVVTWEKGKDAKLVKQITVNSLKFKNNKYATVSHDAVSENGKLVWEDISNAYNKNNNSPYFTFSLKAGTVKDYEDGDKKNNLKATKEQKTLVKNYNKDELKERKYYFEIRRRKLVDYDPEYPEAQTVYAELKDDVLKFSKNGKNVTATVQVRVPYSLEDNEEEDTSEETAKGKNEEKTEAKATKMELIIPLKKIGKNGEFSKATRVTKKGDFIWFRDEIDTKGGIDDLVDSSKKNGNDYDKIFVITGVNNFENSVAFRMRNDSEETIGSGYYEDEKNNYITSIGN